MVQRYIEIVRDTNDDILGLVDGDAEDLPSLKHFKPNHGVVSGFAANHLHWHIANASFTNSIRLRHPLYWPGLEIETRNPVKHMILL